MPRLTSRVLRTLTPAQLRAMLDDHPNEYDPKRKMILRELLRRAGGHADRNQETKQ